MIEAKIKDLRFGQTLGRWYVQPRDSDFKLFYCDSEPEARALIIVIKMFARFIEKKVKKINKGRVN